MARGSLPSYDNFTTMTISRVTLSRSHRTSPLSAPSFGRVISHALDNPPGYITRAPSLNHQYTTKRPTINTKQLHPLCFWKL